MSEHGHGQAGRRRTARGLCAVLLGWCVIGGAGPGVGAGRAAEFEDARALLLKGDYTGCVAMAEGMIRERPYSLQWPLYLIEGLTTLGRYDQALTAVTNSLGAESRSTRLRWLAADVFRRTGHPKESGRMIDEIIEFTAARPWAYRDAADLVVFGRAALLRNADPKDVLDHVFEPAKKAEPTTREPYLAIVDLALEKGDYELAAKTCREALDRLPGDPDLHFALARAYEGSDRKAMAKEIEAALKINPKHLPSLLFLAEEAIDAEDYDEATQLLARVRAVNPYHPEAWALLAVIAELKADTAGYRTAREMALKQWPTNPEVPHLLGRKLSQKYRFREGAALQREALKFDPDFFPAKLQLARDLLRLGNETDGWRLAEEAHNADGYNVAALNLVTLRDTLQQFATLTNAHFIVRMEATEAAVYGRRVLALLERARAALCPRYGLELREPIMVELFDDQKDFAVRTFGMPENHGFLGVCFGPVITANSPASRPGEPFNWEAVLWHEFCHVVTLHLTHNKMPRWLSEGISVYEERQAGGPWGERMEPEYREMILGGELTPVSRLSGAFLAPESPQHLQFAYYESSLVVEYLVREFGHEKLVALLRALGEGEEINAALARLTRPLSELEPGFAAFAKSRAEALAPDLDWSKPEEDSALAGAGEEAWKIWAKTRPHNFEVLVRRARARMEAKDWAGAREVLLELTRRFPDWRGPESAWRRLAVVQRELGDPAGERAAWEALERIDDKAAEASRRLIELAVGRQDWPAVLRHADRLLAINPLDPAPWRARATAAEALGQAETAIEAWRAILRLDPPNPALAHYRLATQLRAAGQPGARQELLLALEDAPRFRAALDLLLEMSSETPRPARFPRDAEPSPAAP